MRGYADSESRSGHANGRNYVTVEADKCLIRAHYTYLSWCNECHDNRNVQAPATLARPLPYIDLQLNREAMLLRSHIFLDEKDENF